MSLWIRWSHAENQIVELTESDLIDEDEYEREEEEE
jgi:hypothetical protein